MVLNYGNDMHRCITLSRERLTRIGGGDIINGVSQAISFLSQGLHREVFEPYDASADYEYSIDTSMFDIVFDTRNNASGGHMVEYLMMKHIDTILPPNVYGNPNCFFDCVDYALGSKLKARFDVKGIKKGNGNIK